MGFEDLVACRALKAKLEEQISRGEWLVEKLEPDPAAREKAKAFRRSTEKMQTGLAFVETWLRMLDLGIQVSEKDGLVVARWYEGIAGFPSEDLDSPRGAVET